MNSARFVRILSQHLARLRATAQLLAEARQGSQPTETAEATLQQNLAAYAWSVRSRALLVVPAQSTDKQPALASAAELHIRLSVIEALLATRSGQLPAPQDEPTGEEAPATQAVLQRLATAESRLFHLFGVIPLN